MWLGALGGAAISLIPLYLLTHWLRSFSWLPNSLGTFLGCCIITAIAVLMLLLHFAHTILFGIALAVLGLPLLILTNRFPMKA